MPEGRSRRPEFGNSALRLDRDLAPGMCVTIEPGIYLVPAFWERDELIHRFQDVLNRPKIDALLADQFGGIRIEETLCVRAAGGPEVGHRLPVDPAGRPGHRALRGASFAPNPIYFDPENIVELAIEGGCNAVASTLGVLGSVGAEVRPQDPVHRQAQPQRAADLPEQVRPDMFASSSRPSTWARSRSARRSTSARRSRNRQIQEVSEAFQQAHELGMVTVLWCYLRNSAFKKDGVDYHAAADLTGQANHLGVTIEADIIKQKLARPTTAASRRDRLRQDAASSSTRS
jgi:hypothetical protein